MYIRLKRIDYRIQQFESELYCFRYNSKFFVGCAILITRKLKNKIIK